MKISSPMIASSASDLGTPTDDRHYTFSYMERTVVPIKPEIFKHTFNEVTIQADKNIKMSVYVPSQRISVGTLNQPKGLIIGVHIYVNGVLYNLGNSGTSSNSSIYNKKSKGAYYNEKVLDLVNRGIVPAGQSYKFKAEFRMQSDGVPIELNGSGLGINKVHKDDGKYIEGSRNQFFPTITIEEYTL